MLVGDYVVIGANAVVRGAILRDGARVEELSGNREKLCCLKGSNCADSMVEIHSVLSEGSAVAGVVQRLLGEKGPVGRWILDGYDLVDWFKCSTMKPKMHHLDSLVVRLVQRRPLVWEWLWRLDAPYQQSQSGDAP